MLSPIGKVLISRLDKPDTKFSDAGIYSITLEFSLDTSSEFRSYLDYQMEQSAAAAKVEHKLKKVKEASVPYAVNHEDETFKAIFKMKASGITRAGEPWSHRPEVFDQELNLIDPYVPTGSLVRVSYTPRHFYTSLIGAGVTLHLDAVQVQQLESTHPVTAKYGFTVLKT